MMGGDFPSLVPHPEPSQPVSDAARRQLYALRYKTIWIAQTIKTGLSLWLLHLILSLGFTLFLPFYPQERGQLVNIVATVVTPGNMLYIFVWTLPASLAQVYLISVWLTDERFLRPRWWQTVRLRHYPGAVLLAVVSGFFAHSYMTIWNRSRPLPKNAEEVCPSVGGPSTICYGEQEWVIVGLAGGATLVLFFLRLKKGFGLRYHPMIVDWRERAQSAVSFGCFNSTPALVLLVPISVVVYVMLTSTFLFSHFRFYLDNMFQLGLFFNLRFLFNLVIFPAGSLVAFNACWQLAEYSMTMPLDLPLEGATLSPMMVNLAEAMRQGPPHMRYLAFYQLYTTTNMPKFDLDPRAFFLITRPGRTPRNWAGIRDAVLDECRKMIHQLSIFIGEHCSDVRSRFENQIIFPKNVLDRVKPRPPDDNPDSRKFGGDWREEMRDLGNPPSSVPPDMASNPQVDYHIQFIRDCLRYLWVGLCHLFRKIRAYLRVTYLEPFRRLWLVTDPRWKLANILVNWQLVSWGVQGLMGICALSIHFDSHGVVQQDLLNIAEVILSLHDHLTISTGVLLEKEGTVNKARFQETQYIDRLVRKLEKGVGFSIIKFHHLYSPYYQSMDMPLDWQDRFRLLVEKRPKQRTPFTISM